jgi:hypothetical protein
MTTLTPQLLTEIAGVVLSLAFSYLPGLKERFEKLDPNSKRLVMLGLLVAACVVVMLLACGNVWNGLGLVCTQAGVVELVELLIRAAIANQAAYLLSPKPVPAERG